jgi:hypothetical protein
VITWRDKTSYVIECHKREGCPDYTVCAKSPANFNVKHIENSKIRWSIIAFSNVFTKCLVWGLRFYWVLAHNIRVDLARAVARTSSRPPHACSTGSLALPVQLAAHLKIMIRLALLLRLLLRRATHSLLLLLRAAHLLRLRHLLRAASSVLDLVRLASLLEEFGELRHRERAEMDV